MVLPLPGPLFLRVLSGILTPEQTVSTLSSSEKPLLTRGARTERALVLLWPLAHILMAVL